MPPRPPVLEPSSNHWRLIAHCRRSRTAERRRLLRHPQLHAHVPVRAWASAPPNPSWPPPSRWSPTSDSSSSPECSQTASAGRRCSSSRRAVHRADCAGLRIAGNRATSCVIVLVQSCWADAHPQRRHAAQLPGRNVPDPGPLQRLRGQLQPLQRALRWDRPLRRHPSYRQQRQCLARPGTWSPPQSSPLSRSSSRETCKVPATSRNKQLSYDSLPEQHQGKATSPMTITNIRRTHRSIAEPRATEGPAQRREG